MCIICSSGHCRTVWCKAPRFQKKVLYGSASLALLHAGDEVASPMGADRQTSRETLLGKFRQQLSLPTDPCNLVQTIELRFGQSFQNQALATKLNFYTQDTSLYYLLRRHIISCQPLEES